MTCYCRCGARWAVDLALIDRTGIVFACIGCHQEIKVAFDPMTGRYLHWDVPLGVA